MWDTKLGQNGNGNIIERSLGADVHIPNKKLFIPAQPGHLPSPEILDDPGGVFRGRLSRHSLTKIQHPSFPETGFLQIGSSETLGRR